MSGYLKDSSRKQPVLSRGTVVSPVSRFGQSGDKTPGDGTPTRGGDKTGRGLSPYPLRFVDIRRCEARGPAPGRSPHGEGRARWGGMSSARTDGPNGARQRGPLAAGPAKLCSASRRKQCFRRSERLFFALWASYPVPYPLVVLKSEGKNAKPMPERRRAALSSRLTRWRCGHCSVP